MFLPCPPTPTPPTRPLPLLSLFLGSDFEMSHQLLAIQWPPLSAGTLLTDSPAQGWARERAGLPTSQSIPVSLPLSPTHIHTPALAVPQPPTWPPFLWPPGSCHLGSTIPVEVGSRGPHLQGLRFPPAPLFLLKGTDCNWGLAPASPQPLAPTLPKARC